MNRIYIVQKIINALGARTYLEIGVRKGVSFLPIKCPRKIGIDPRSLPPRIRERKNIEGEFYFQQTSDDFFKVHGDLFEEEKIDVVLIDGEHSYRQSLADVNHCLEYLSEAGVIVLHDCNPVLPIYATPMDKLAEAKRSPQWDGYWNGDVYRTIIHLRSRCRHLSAFVLDCDWGVGIVLKRPSAAEISLSLEDIGRMSYEEFNRDRCRLLDLRHCTYLFSFLETLG